MIKLTELKELYEKALDKWIDLKIHLDKYILESKDEVEDYINDAVYELCAFCNDAGLVCSICKIDKEICNDSTDAGYIQGFNYCETHDEVYNLICEICNKLEWWVRKIE